MKLLICFLLGFGLSVSTIDVFAQNSTSVECGTIIEGEFDEKRQQIFYSIDLQAGTELSVTGVPFGDTLTFVSAIYAPDGSNVGFSNSFNSIASIDQENDGEIVSNTGILSANGKYTILLANGNINLLSAEFWWNDNGGVGIYTLYIKCSLRDGTVIEPSQISQEVVNATNTPQTGSVSGFLNGDLRSFPSFDISASVKLPLIPATAMTGAITPAGGEIMGFMLDAAVNDKLDLAISRVSGNLNLGVVVLSPENQVVFYGGLITSESLSTRLTLPSAGQYTIGVFRVDVLPPAVPEATAFQVTGTLNPA